MPTFLGDIFTCVNTSAYTSNSTAISDSNLPKPTSSRGRTCLLRPVVDLMTRLIEFIHPGFKKQRYDFNQLKICFKSLNRHIALREESPKGHDALANQLIDETRAQYDDWYEQGKNLESHITGLIKKLDNSKSKRNSRNLKSRIEKFQSEVQRKNTYILALLDEIAKKRQSTEFREIWVKQASEEESISQAATV